MNVHSAVATVSRRGLSRVVAQPFRAARRAALRPCATKGRELEQPRRHENPAALAEKQAARRHDAGAAELDGADLVAVAIEDVGVRHRERDPQLAVAIDRGGADSPASPAAARLRWSAVAARWSACPQSTRRSRAPRCGVRTAVDLRRRTSGTPARRSRIRTGSRRSGRRAGCRCSAPDAARRPPRARSAAAARSCGARRRSIRIR